MQKECHGSINETRAKKRVSKLISRRWNAPGENDEAKTATIVAGHIRTGKFEQVQINVRESIFEPLGTTDLYWIVSDSALSVEDKILTTLQRWGGIRRIVSVWLDFVNDEEVKTIEHDCVEKIDIKIGLSLRECRPARPQFIAMAMAWRAVIAAENKRRLTYDWILRLRTDMVYKKKLPPYTTWNAAPRAIYLDGWRWFVNCSKSTSCTCFCVGDRFGIVHRSLAHHVFATALDLLQNQGCKSLTRCPSLFKEPPDSQCFNKSSKVKKKQRKRKTSGNKQNKCFLHDKSHLYNECILGSMLIEAGLNPYTQIKKLFSGDLISCGSGNSTVSRFYSPTNKTFRISDDAGTCEIPYWRPPGRKNEISQSIFEKPIDHPKEKPTLFWLDHHHSPQ